jgi:ABC-type multidrug transport system ATPase subunit
VLAQRKDSGEIYGSVLIDGRPVGISFQRTTGYCEQMDVHLETATVKEALEFSAVLRQPSTVPHEEKIAYVEHIIDLLELRDISEALIGGMFDVLMTVDSYTNNSQCLELDSASNSANA